MFEDSRAIVRMDGGFHIRAMLWPLSKACLEGSPSKSAAICRGSLVHVTPGFWQLGAWEHVKFGVKGLRWSQHPLSCRLPISISFTVRVIVVRGTYRVSNNNINASIRIVIHSITSMSISKRIGIRII